MQARTCGATPSTPDAPFVNSSQALSTSFLATWSPPARPNGILRRYVLTVDGSEVYRGLLRQTEVLDLSPFTTYALQLEVCSEDPCSGMLNCASSPVFMAQTGAGIPAGQPIPTLTVRSARAIEVSWQPPSQANGVISRYQVLRSDAVVYDGASRTYLDDNLAPNTRYAYRVRAFNSAGSTTSSLAFARTQAGAPENVTAPTVQVQSDSSLQACWTIPAVPNGVISHYIVLLDGVEAARTTSLCATLDGLEPNTVYSLRVQACTSEGCGTSPTITATTRCAVPRSNVPSSLEPTATAVAVAWDAPATPRCSLTLYRLEVSAKGA